MKKLLVALALPLSLLFVGCGSDKKTTTESDEFTDTTQQESVPDSVKEKQAEMLDFKFFYTLANLPSPMEMINSIYKNNVPFNRDILNSTDNFSNYNSAFKKAVNYGVYGIDMAYAAFYGQNQDLLNYYTTSKKMAEKLNVEETFDRFTQSFRDNSNNKDSLIKIIDRAYSETDNYLRSNRRLEVASHVLAGSIIEAQYLSINLVKDGEKTEANKDIYDKIYNQKLYLDNLISLFSDLTKYPSSSALLAQLKEMKAEYDKIKSAEDLNKTTIQPLAVVVSKVRNDLVK